MICASTFLSVLPVKQAIFLVPGVVLWVIKFEVFGFVFLVFVVVDLMNAIFFYIYIFVCMKLFKLDETGCKAEQGIRARCWLSPWKKGLSPYVHTKIQLISLAYKSPGPVK